MRALILVVSACGFRGAPTEGPHDGSLPGDGLIHDAPSLDGAVDSRPIDGAAPDAMADATVPDAGFSCSTGAPAPKACFLFENNLTDGSGNNVPLALTAGTVSYAAGATGQAIVLSVQDQLSIASSAANLVSFPAIAIKTYVKLPTLPGPGTRMGIIDNDAYRLFIQAGGTVRCAIGGGGSIKDHTTTLGISANTWTRITCTYDGTTMLIYFNGVPQLIATAMGSNGPVPAVTTSTEIAGNQGSATDQLVGALDDFELFATTQIAP